MGQSKCVCVCVCVHRCLSSCSHFRNVWCLWMSADCCRCEVLVKEENLRGHLTDFGSVLCSAHRTLRRLQGRALMTEGFDRKSSERLLEQVWHSECFLRFMSVLEGHSRQLLQGTDEGGACVSNRFSERNPQKCGITSRRRSPSFEAGLRAA